MEATKLTKLIETTDGFSLRLTAAEARALHDELWAVFPKGPTILRLTTALCEAGVCRP